MDAPVVIVLLGCWVTDEEICAALASNDDAPSDTTVPDVVIEMTGIPSGAFCMGSEDDYADFDEDPVHAVTLTHGFWIGRTEVTQAQWEAVMGTWSFGNDGCEDCPAEQLSWEDAALFANALSTAEGLDACYEEDGSDVATDPYACEGYRLPTEAEWEYAARARADTTYAGSDDPDKVAWYDDNSGEMSHEVCGLDVNAWGLCDMSGNVCEWTGDWYDDAYYEASPAEDPAGAGAGSDRVDRGGSWYDPSGNLRTSFRYWVGPGDRRVTLGLRVARAGP